MPAHLAIVPAAGAARRPAAEARHLHPSALPQWRALLEMRRQELLEQIAEFALACSDAEQAAADTSSGPAARQAAWQQATRILHRTGARQRALAEIAAALRRLATGRYGWCERCGSPLTIARLAGRPQARFCGGCAQCGRHRERPGRPGPG